METPGAGPRGLNVPPAPGPLGATAEGREVAALRTELDELKRKAPADIEADVRARETAEGLESQARATLEQADAIQGEAMRFRNEARDARSEAAALHADAQDPWREARTGADVLIRDAQMRAEATGQQTEDESRLLRSEAHAVKALAEA